MEELIAKLDDEITAVLDMALPLREQLAEAEAKLAKLIAGKAALTGQSVPAPRKHGKTLAMGRKPGSGRPGTRIEAVCKALEEKGPLTFSDLIRESGIKHDAQFHQIMKSRPDWFTQVNGKGSAYTLTEAGRNRHKTEAAA